MKNDVSEILISLLEEVPGQLEKFLNDRKKEKIYFMLAPSLYVLMLILISVSLKQIRGWEKAEDWLGEFMDGLETSLPTFIGQITGSFLQNYFVQFVYFAVAVLIATIMYLVFTFLSEILMEKLLKRDLFFLKRCAYEQINKHYYLRPQYVKVRDLFQVLFTASSWALAAAGLINVAFSDNDYLDIRNSIFALVFVTVWIKLESNYYSGNTYNEVMAVFDRPKTPGGYPVRFLHELVIGLPENTLLDESLRYYPVKYGISYPGISYSHQYQALFSALMKEKNILIEHVFYHDWERAFILPMHAMLLKDRKVIIFSGPTMEADQIKIWIEEQLSRFFLGKPRWKTVLWNGVVIESDVVIVPFERISEFIRNIDASMQRTKGLFQVVLEPSRISAEMQSYLEEYAEYIKEKNFPVTYCFADRQIKGLLDHISHVFQCHIEEIEVSNDRCGDVFLCNAQSRGQSKRTSLLILQELIKKGAENICYVSECNIAVKDLRNEIKRSMSISGQDDDLLMEHAIQKIQFLRGIWEIKRDKLPYIIMENNWHNYYDLYRYLSSRGVKLSAVFILEERKTPTLQYMLRNAKKYLDDRCGIPVLYPIYQDTKRNRLLKIIRCTANSKGQNRIDLSVILKYFPEWKRFPIDDILKKLNRLSVKYYKKTIFTYNINGFVVSGTFLDDNERLWREAVIIDEERKAKLLGMVLICQIDQRWLPGQIIARDGCAYEVLYMRKGAPRLELMLRRSSQFWDKSSFYCQKRDIQLNNIRLLKALKIDSGVYLIKCLATITVTTKSWYIEDGGGKILQERKCSVPERLYRSKKLMFLCRSSGTAEDITAFFSDLTRKFQEICRVLYPYHHYYLYFLYMQRVEIKGVGNCPGLCIVEDSEDDLGLLESLEKYMKELLDLKL